jgi:hypothetical protein
VERTAWGIGGGDELISSVTSTWLLVKAIIRHSQFSPI